MLVTSVGLHSLQDSKEWVSGTRSVVPGHHAASSWLFDRLLYFPIGSGSGSLFHCVGTNGSTDVT